MQYGKQGKFRHGEPSGQAPQPPLTPLESRYGGSSTRQPTERYPVHQDQGQYHATRANQGYWIK